MSLPLALLVGCAFALSIGVVNGIPIAYVEIPAIFATLAVATSVTGLGRFALVDRDNVYISGDIGWLGQIGAGRIIDIPVPVIVFAALACAAFVGLRYTKYGGFIYAMGDNPLAARNAGIAMRPMTVLVYGISAMIAFAAGIVMATMVASVDTRLVGTTMVYDIISDGYRRIRAVREREPGQRDCRYGVDRPFAQRFNDHGHLLPGPEHHQKLDPAFGNHSGFDPQPSGRADFSARRHLIFVRPSACSAQDDLTASNLLAPHSL